MSGNRTRFANHFGTPLKLVAAHYTVDLIPICHITGINPANFFICNIFILQSDLFVCTLRNRSYIKNYIGGTGTCSEILCNTA